MTTTTIAPSVFSRSSTWTDQTSLTQHSDMLAGDGPVKRRFRDSRDSSLFTRPPTSARSSIISHPPIPFRTRSLGFNYSEDGAPESPSPLNSDRRQFSTRMNRSKSSERRKPESIHEQPPTEEDSDDVFSLEVTRTSTATKSSSSKAPHHLSIDKQAEGFAAPPQRRASLGIDQLGNDLDVHQLAVLAESHPSSISSSKPQLGSIPSSSRTATSLSEKGFQQHVSDMGPPSLPKSQARSSPIIASSAASRIGPPAPERTSSLRARSLHSKHSRASLSKDSLSSSKRQLAYFDPVPEAKEVTSNPRSEEFVLPVRTQNTVGFSEGTRSLDIPESENSLSMDDSDFDDGSSGITDYSDETMKDERRMEGLGPVLQLVLANIRRDVVSKVIQELHGSQQEHGQTTKQTGSSANYQRGASSDAATPSSQPSKGSGKRPSRDRDSNTPDDREDGDNDKRRKLHHAPALLRSRFACPFYKHNSENHQRWRSCRGPGWDEVRRVK
jgi:hypothetical protein